ncbi:membrane metallo-endopeptidase-like 1 isoform X2 [Eurytemora carolleeae]|uniref:membrane metallo-endopeptidase-like 1 isoform X2 n=1 Tax=Eurytemora carolleeae TaxID=1294199 RepID=UPI000C75EA30|nr:membrane metallo-endopeptidase-like 1 isoform X2 [Eurytemora carolleeae]|eukprot:XP_023320293.1 membrane metallo-endopeptidase-like 1 isoform X2 [Eurytemora affinis]
MGGREELNKRWIERETHVLYESLDGYNLIPLVPPHHFTSSQFNINRSNQTRSNLDRSRTLGRSHPKDLGNFYTGTIGRSNYNHATINRANLSHKPLRRCEHDHCARSQPNLDELTPQLLITHASVAVMASAEQQASGLERGEERYEYKTRSTDCCQSWCERGGVERIVVLLLLGALLIIFSTVVLSLFYLKTMNTTGLNVVFSRQEVSERTLLKDPSPSHPSPNLPCSTHQCLTLAARIESVSSRQGDPCSSFYEAACGGWVGSRNITRPMDTISVLDQLKLDIDKNIRDLIMSLGDSNNGFGKLKSFFISCSDEDTIRRRRSEPIINFIKEHFSPALDPMTGDTGDLTDIITDLLMFGGSSMFDVSVDIHPFNSSQYIILVKLPSHSNLPALFPVPGDPLYPTLDPLYPTLEPTKQYPTPDNEYPNLGPNSLYPKTKSAFESSGFEPSSSSSDSHGIFSDPKPGSNLKPINIFSSFNHKNKSEQGRQKRELKQTQQNIISSQQLFQDIQNAAESHSIGNLINLVEEFDLLSSYSQPFKQTTADEIVGFIAALSKALPDRNQELKAFRENRVYNLYTLQELQSCFKYVNWGLLMDRLVGKQNGEERYMVQFPSHLRQIERVVSLFGVRIARLGLLVLYGRDFLSSLVNLNSSQERWRTCSQVTQGILPIPSSHLYINSATQFDRNQLLSRVKDLGSKVKTETLKHLDRTSWMSSKSKRRVLRKVERVQIDVDIPHIFLDRDLVLQSIQNINISQNDYFGNVVSLVRIHKERIYSLLRRRVNRAEYSWSVITSPLGVNAFHIRQLNSVLVPYGLVSSFLHISPGAPQYTTDAPVAFIIAHELIHSVDPTGVGWDENGKLSDILDNTSLNRYDKKLECVKDTISKVGQIQDTYQGQRIRIESNPEISIGESIADIEAMNVVSNMFDYKTRIAGSHFSPSQLFFLNIAQGYCGIMGSLAKLVHLHINPHSPSQSRIDNLALFSSSFSETFQCPTGSRLYPVNQCLVFGAR